MSTETAQQIFDAAYWEAQPAAVKPLQTMAYGLERVQLVQKLVSEGYIIDMTIMGWAWDPYVTMQQRELYGYTWVPSAGMPPIQVAPRVSQGNVPPYDAAVIPPGAIMVTTDPTKLAGQYPAPTGA
jgi:hypothetical protein